MTVPGNIDALLLGGQRGYQIERSLRFNSADSAYLNRTPASAGNRRTYTISMWVKRGKLGAAARLFGSYSSANAFFEAAFDNSNNLYWYYYTYPGISYQRTTSQVFRDSSAWMHLVFAFDSTNATAADRMKIYANGQQITTFSTTVNPTQNFDCLWNSTSNNVLGDMLYNNAPGSSFDGYIAEVYSIDGTALTPSSFGETDTITGVWKPKKYAGTYGTNGFYLKFADNSGTTSTTLGKDSSGNGNNWTPNNFSVTAGAGNDSMIDVPTPYADGGNGRGNYCTLNAVSPLASGTLSNGNLSFSTGNADAIAVGTVAVSSGKWYWEITATNVNASLSAIGIIGQPPASLTVDLRTPSNGYCYISNGNKGNNNTTAAYGATYTSGDVIGVALDLDAGTLVFYKNNSSQGTAYSSLSGTFSPAISDLSGASGGAVFDCNFGQHSFSYGPPAGFSALNTQNLPEPSIKKPSSYFDTLIYTGDGSTTRSITGLSFSPDLLWHKSRNATDDHRLMDSVRAGGTDLSSKTLFSNLTNAEDTSGSGYVTQTSSGFNLGVGASPYNVNTRTYVAWCWDKSATPGFDIVTYTGDGSNSRTISHSLGVAPAFYITKNRDGYNAAQGFNDWNVYHKSITGTNSTTGGPVQAFLMSTGAASSGAGGICAAPTSTVFSPAINAYDNVSTKTYVAYLWSEVAGFSKFGSYTGNGSSDGPFVFCGFRPRWIMMKSSTNAATPWQIFDSARETFNTIEQTLIANGSNAEPYDTASPVDFLSNGFKLRGGGASYNNYNTGTWIFAAFAETPMKYSLAF